MVWGRDCSRWASPSRSGLAPAKQSLAVTCASSHTCTPGSGGPSGSPDGGTSSATLATFTPPTDPGAGGILFAASGEVLALTGYSFPPVNDGDPAFVDGWDVHFTRLLVTLDNITLSNGPDVTPGDQSCTEPTVAKVTGPWAVDLSHSDTQLPAREGGRRRGGGSDRGAEDAELPRGEQRRVRHQRHDALRVRLRHRPRHDERHERQHRRARAGRLRADGRRRVRGALRRDRHVQRDELHLSHLR